MRKMWSAVMSTLALGAALLLPSLALAEGTCGEAPCPELIASGATGGSVNSLGEVVWTKPDPATGQQQLFSSRRGQLTFQQYNEYSHFAPSINNVGDTVWSLGDGYGSSFLGTNISGTETGGMMMQPPFFGGDTDADINDRQEVVWTALDMSFTTQIYSNVRGRLTTDWSNYYRPSINNNGDVVFVQYGMGPGQVFKIGSGSTIPEAVTSDNLDHLSVAINDNGEIVWAAKDLSGTSIVSTVRGVLPIAVTGDLSRVDINNCGDVVYSVNENGVQNVYRWGNNAPCVSGGQNTTLAQASQVKSGDLFTGAVDAASSEQWYRFDATAGQKIQVLANYDTRSPNALTIGLYNGEGSLLSGPTASSPLGIVTSAAYSGTYYLKAQAVAGAFPFYVSLSKYSQNCGEGPCQDFVASRVDYDPSINSLGEVAWRQFDPATNTYPIFSSTRGQLPVTMDGPQNGPVAINNHGDVAWLDGDYPAYHIRALIAGQEITLATDDYFASVEINDLGEVLWTGRYGIYSTLRGQLTDSSLSPGRPSLNNNGDVVFFEGNSYATYKIAGGTTTLEQIIPWSSGFYPVITDAGDIISPWFDDNGNTRFTSTVQGDLGYLVPGWINNLDANSCGDLLYSVMGYPSTTSDVYRLGLNVPCMTEPQRSFNLAVARTADSTGTGTVTSSPAVINLTASDKFSMAALPAGSVVTLTATPDANSVFLGWTGACSGTGTCQVTMDLVKNVKASFQPNNDTEPPIVTITSPVAGFTKNNYPQLLYSVSDGNVVTKLDGVIVSWTSGGYLHTLSEGEHVVRVESTDGSGNLGFAEVRFTVDNIAPIINISSPVAGVTNVNRPVLNYTVSEGTVTVKVNGYVVNKVSGDALDTLADGYYSVQVGSTDAAGNSAYANVTFTVDTTPPAVIISSPASGRVIANNQPYLFYTVYEGTVVVKVDGAVVNKVSGDHLDLLADGPHTLRMESTDAAGNTGFAESNFIVDTIPPTVSITSPAAGTTNDNTPALGYTVNEGQVTVKVDSVIVSKVSGDSLATLPDGLHTLTVQSIDAAGNAALAQVQFTVDTTAPTVAITSPAAGLTKVSSPVLSYNVSDGTVVVKVDGAVVNKVSGSTLDTLADGNHIVRVESTDAAGNFASTQRSFTVDTAAPVVAISSPVAGTTPDHTPYLNYTSTDGTIVVKVDGISVNTRAVSNLSALANGTHTLTVESADAAGNVGVATVTFTVDYTPLLLTPVALAYGVTGTNYSQRLTATGSVQPYVWSVNYGALPPGLSLNSATGEITGVPTAAGVFDFYVKVAADNGTETYSVGEGIKIFTPVAITAVSLGSGYAGEAYAGSVSATGGAGNYAWSVASGTLPAGLTLNSSTGAISGTPSAAGTFTFTVQATDYHSAATQTMTVVINPARPDLVVTSVYGPTSSGGGRKVAVYATVYNRGAGTAPASTVSIYLSNDSSITSADLHLAFASAGSLTSGSSQVVAVSTTLPKTLPGGNYYFGAIADEPASMEESNETNNAQVGNMVSVK